MGEFPKRIVYVDDESSVRALVREALERMDPDLVVVTCSSGAELLNRLRELQPELILLDLKMPDMSGPDVVDALHKRPEGAEVPVIFVTAKTKVEMTEEFTSLSVIGIIYKPFEVMKLIESIGEFWRAYQEAKIKIPEK
jgi:CheY-like chemotaxis protein